jgi:hypothetical protein
MDMTECLTCCSSKKLKRGRGKKASRKKEDEIFVAQLFRHFGVFSGLPDGLFSNQKSKFGSILEGLAMEDYGILYGLFVHFTVFCYILSTFGIVRSNLVHFFPFLVFCTKKNLAALFFSWICDEKDCCKKEQRALSGIAKLSGKKRRKKIVLENENKIMDRQRE